MYTKPVFLQLLVIYQQRQLCSMCITTMENMAALIVYIQENRFSLCIYVSMSNLYCLYMHLRSSRRVEVQCACIDMGNKQPDHTSSTSIRKGIRTHVHCICIHKFYTQCTLIKLYTSTCITIMQLSKQYY